MQHGLPVVYVLTCRMKRQQTHVFISSELHSVRREPVATSLMLRISKKVPAASLSGAVGGGFGG